MDAETTGSSEGLVIDVCRKCQCMEKALQFYGNEKNYELKRDFSILTGDAIHGPGTIVDFDEGERARKALNGSWTVDNPY